VKDTPASRCFTLEIVCRWPRSRARDDWHVQPERVARTLAVFIGGDAEMKLTPRTVRLHGTSPHRISDVAYWHLRMALVMHCLRLEVPQVQGDFQLPAPVRTVIHESDRP
jgi:hypothetical protein